MREPIGALVCSVIALGAGCIVVPERRAPRPEEAVSTEAIFEQGERNLKDGRPNEAIAAFREVVRREPDMATGYFHLGLAYGDTRQYEMATDAFSRALILEPRDPETHFFLGLMLESQRRLPEASRHYLDAIRLKPNYIDAYFSLGQVCVEMRQYQIAALALRDYLGLAQQMRANAENVAFAQEQLGQLEASLRPIEPEPGPPPTSQPPPMQPPAQAEATPAPPEEPTQPRISEETRKRAAEVAALALTCEGLGLIFDGADAQKLKAECRSMYIGQALDLMLPESDPRLLGYVKDYVALIVRGDFTAKNALIATIKQYVAQRYPDFRELHSFVNAAIK